MNLPYIIKEGFAGIKRAKLAASTSIFSLFVAILLLGILSRVSYNIYMQAMSFKDLIEVEVFLFEVDERTTQDVQTTLENSELVLEYTYISKDSASAIMREEFGPGVDELVALNFLPASFRVKVDTEAGVDQISNFVSLMLNQRGVDEVKYNEGLLRVMESNLNLFSMIGAGIGILILLAAVILVYNTIRLTIYAKRELIRAMKLVGATNSFIRSPFIVEGILQGVIAGSLSIGLMFAIFEFVLPLYLPEMGILGWPFGQWYFLVAAMLGLSILMGWLGSRFAARKFIEETYISG
jgi:cell division transport system permease protein